MSQLVKIDRLNISKNISYYLRHKPDELGIQLDLEGWVKIDEFLGKFNKKHQIDLDVN